MSDTKLVTLKELSNRTTLTESSILEFMGLEAFDNVGRTVSNKKITHINPIDFIKIIKNNEFMRKYGLKTSMEILESNPSLRMLFNSEGDYRSKMSTFARKRVIRFIDVSEKEDSTSRDRIFFEENVLKFLSAYEKPSKVVSLEPKNDMANNAKENTSELKLTTNLKALQQQILTISEDLSELKSIPKDLSELKSIIISLAKSIVDVKNNNKAAVTVNDELPTLNYESILKDLLAARASGVRNPDTAWDTKDEDFLTNMKSTLDECAVDGTSFEDSISKKQKNTLYAIKSAYKNSVKRRSNDSYSSLQQ